MIELKNITKVYQSKQSGSVTALDNVSIKFPEKGLVFVLGKSGSGKSTLLNVMGGLDKANSGEIIIKGKSSKDFSQSDFDSYRNTYLGFIFQEYNILEDFTIGANIALAIKLQGQKPSDKQINDILHEVDLDGFGKRKPNELSGGQRQRVAIARALVKNPEIIMADEPTGALDSNTGIQVFDTLKKLSNDKLVIVVSHDRDFAERYGDRIIEFKDGKVISDTEKHQIEAEKTIDGVLDYQGKLLKYPQGYHLTQRDIDNINDYLTNNDAVLSVDNNIINKVYEQTHINKDGMLETFENTDESKIKHNDSGFKLIKSHLPYWDSLKIGASSLKTKPIRLLITIILCVACFSMFGSVDSFASYNSYDAITNALQEEDINILSFKKQQTPKEDDDSFFYYYQQLLLTDRDIGYLSSKLEVPVYGVYGKGSDYGNSFSYSSCISEQPQYDSIYTGKIYGLVEIGDPNDLKELGILDGFVGRIPSNDDEVIITDFIFDTFKTYGYVDNIDNNSLTTTEISNMSYDRFLSTTRYISLNTSSFMSTQNVYKIVGICKTNYDFSKYIDNKADDTDITSILLKSQLEVERDYLLTGVMFCNKGYTTKLYDASHNDSKYQINNYISISTPIFYGDEEYSNTILGSNYIKKFSSIPSADVLFVDGNTHTNLNEGEILVNVDSINSVVSMLSTDNNDDMIPYIDYSFPTYEPDYTQIFAFLSQLDKTINIEYYDSVNNIIINRQVKIVGIDLTEDNNSTICVDDSIFELITNCEKGKYYFALANRNGSKSTLKTAVDLALYPEDNSDITYPLNNRAYQMESSVGGIFKTLAKVFLYVGIGILVLCILMFINYIATSISFKRREIGILRAVGARSLDVFGIFFNEALIIAIFTFIVSSTIVGITMSAINSTIANEYLLPINILNFGIRQVGIILASCVGTATISSFIPVIKIAKKEPIDAIKK